jgi:hypothetical protein
VAELLRKGDDLVVSGEGAATEPPLKRGQKPTMPKSPLGPTWTSLSRLIEQVKDALVVLNQPLRYVAPLRRPARADLDLAVALDRTGQGRACRPESAATLRRTSQTHARDHFSRCR